MPQTDVVLRTLDGVDVICGKTIDCPCEKRVELLYGSIEEFLADPTKPKNGNLAKGWEWMRSVSPTEACIAESACSLGPNLTVPMGAPLPELVLSKTPGSVQRKWKVPAEFPLCPEAADATPLATYFKRLHPGATVAISPYGVTRVGKAATSLDGERLFILGEHGPDAIKRWSLTQVTFADGRFVHESQGTFFTGEGAEKNFVLAQGLPWEGGDTFDDFA